MAKYSKGAGEKVGEVMHELKEGELKTGTGKKVTNRKQAIAIALSEAREEGEKVPAKKPATKISPKKAASKKEVASKKSAKKAVPKKAVKKVAAKKSNSKKAAN